jgi:UDP-GlcNAc:undecaprenyl-phosphate/decaprenyl-phosphate GlcNAc-1-phosphate transferase
VTAYYVSVFLGSVICSVILTGLVRDQAIRRGWFDTPDQGRHLHLRPVPRIGGVALFLTFICVTGIALAVYKLLDLGPTLSRPPVRGILLPALLVFLMGLYDDHFSLGPYSKCGIEAIAAVWLYLAGFGIYQLALFPAHSALRLSLGLPLTILWVLLSTNAFNLIDGLDGLAAGSALFTTTIIFIISLFRHTPLISILTVVLAGAILGFLRYNFHPATIFLGDSGSLSIGFLLSALALAGSQKGTTIVAIAIPVVAFGLPLVDVTVSVARRFLSGRPLFQGDDDHIHHKLIKRGFSHRDAVLVLYGVAAAFGILSLTLLHGEMMLGIVLAVIGLGVCLGVHELKYLEFFELISTVRRLRQRRHLIANNVRLRRAIESFTNGPNGFPDICCVLQATLEPLGFCGAAFVFSQTRIIDESILVPLRQDESGRHCYLWKESLQEWELKLKLTCPDGGRLGDMFIIRAKASEPLWLDINLLNGEFRTAVSEVVNRVIRLNASVARLPDRLSAIGSLSQVSGVTRVSAD